MSLPHATQSQINEMNRSAEEKMKKDGIYSEPVQVQPIENLHPILQHHEEPAEQDSYEQDGYQEDVEEQVEQPIKSVTQETSQQMNFRMMRERLERAERERDEAMKYAISMNQPKQQVQPSQEEDYSDLGVNADDLMEGKHGQKILKELRELKKELNSYKARTTEDTTRIKLTSQFTDYDRVMTQENLNALENANPELAEMISNTPDVYKRAKMAYEMVKKFGIYKDTSYDHDKTIAQKNSSKPRPLASVSPQQSDSPLSKANAFANMPLSKDVKDQLHREMIAAMKGR